MAALVSSSSSTSSARGGRVRCAICAKVDEAGGEGKKRRRMLADLDALVVHVRDAHAGVALREAVPEDYALDAFGGRLVYVDEDLVVAVKPPGVDTATFGHSAWLKVEGASSKADRLAAPQPVHRLDLETSGCLCLGKTASAVAALCGAFRDRRVAKRYVAVACGSVAADSGEIDATVEGKAALTRYEVLRRDPSASHGVVTTLALFPVTGRKHQLRKHLAKVLSAPIAGDWGASADPNWG